MSGGDSEKLFGWDGIAGYLNVTTRTAQLWERNHGLPVRRSPGGRVYALRSELQAWEARREPAQRNSSSRNIGVALFRCGKRLRWRWGVVVCSLFLITFVGLLLRVHGIEWNAVSAGASPAPATSASADKNAILFAMFDMGSPALSKHVYSSLVNHSAAYAHVRIDPIARRFSSEQREQAAREASQRHATAFISGEVSQQNGHGTVWIHMRAIDKLAGVPFMKELRLVDVTMPLNGASERVLDRTVGYFCLITIGIRRFESRAYADAVDALSGAIQASDGPSADPDIARFYRGLAHQALATNLAGPEEADASAAQFRLAIDDFTAVLRRHPAHSGSLWNRALAEAGLAGIDDRHANRSVAVQLYRCAVDDYTRALEPAEPDADFMRSQPNRADVLWNRALAYAALAELDRAAPKAALRYISVSLQDLGHLTNSPGGSSFDAQKLSDVWLNCGFAHRTRAELLRAVGRRSDAEDELQLARAAFTNAKIHNPAGSKGKRAELALASLP